MPLERPAVAITGASGFIGSNLTVWLREIGIEPHAITRETPIDQARSALRTSDIIFHLAGVNRPVDEAEFMNSNRDYTRWLVEQVVEARHGPLLIFSSSTRAEDGTSYGRSKYAAEQEMLRLVDEDLAQVLIYRLPNVFGKWAKPNYNSAVATFCHNIARGLPIRIDDRGAEISLLYIDDLIDQWLDLIAAPARKSGFVEPSHVHHATVGEIADAITAFASGRQLGHIEEVGTDLSSALYATFVSALPTEAFSYPLDPHVDPRGSFSELFKTRLCGQFSFFTTEPGKTRGGHYHHSKVERFVVVHGKGRFRFRHITSGKTHEIRTTAQQPVVVESIPGWTHDVTNIGNDLMVAVVWASELFQPEHPDTVAMPT